MGFFLQDLFVDVANMSITAGYVILFVLLARLLLRKAPKIFSYILWAVVLFRLICPFSFSSAFSFLRAVGSDSGKMEYISSDIGMMAQPQINTGINAVNSVVNASLPAAAPFASTNPMQVVLFILSMVWIVGTVSLLVYSVISYLMLRHEVSTAMLVKDNIFECESISTPFVLGMINPKIYFPVNMKDDELNYILKHEQTHIRRFDYLVKTIAFLALCVHWFNPLVWLGFVLMTKDMEMSCDERVLEELGTDIKKEYSISLLSLASGRKIVSAGPLAFGESNTKSRIKNVLNYKKSAFWVTLIAVIAVISVGIGLISNPANDNPELPALNSGPASAVDGAGGSTSIAAENTDVAKLVEENLSIIMSSPQQSSNPQDYIDTNREAYEKILKYGREEALTYMLLQFETDNAEGLGGHIMMRLCKELLGARNNVTDESLSPQEWYAALSIRQEIELPDYVYDGDDLIEKLVYATETEKNVDSRGGFSVVAPKIFGSYEEGDLLKVFVTTYSARYKLFGNVLSQKSGSVIPAAITYEKDESGGYVLKKYEQARDGSEFAPSIRDYCTMPVSGKKINGLADKILDHYSDYEDIRTLQMENLRKHLKANHLENATLSLPSYSE